MVRRVRVDELVGATEIAECFGLGKSTVVHDWRRRYPDFPQPAARLKGVLIWSSPDSAARLCSKSIVARRALRFTSTVLWRKDAPISSAMSLELVRSTPSR